MSEYNPKTRVKQIKRGAGSFQYLQVADRVYWFREENVEGLIDAELVQWDPERGIAVVKATVTIPGKGVATGLGSACRADLQAKAERKSVQPDQVESYVEFAETAAIGRALGRLGYGTEDALDEAGPVDSPREVRATASANDTRPALISAADQAAIRSAVSSLGWGRADADQYLAQYHVARFSELTAEQAREVVPDLETKAGQVQQEARVA